MRKPERENTKRFAIHKAVRDMESLPLPILIMNLLWSNGIRSLS